jgi:hypothetical protein
VFVCVYIGLSAAVIVSYLRVVAVVLFEKERERRGGGLVNPKE